MKRNEYAYSFRKPFEDEAGFREPFGDFTNAYEPRGEGKGLDSLILSLKGDEK